MFQIKNIDVLNVHPILQELALEIYRLGFDTITSAYRPDDKGVHGTMPIRGLDFRCRDSIIGEKLEEYINERWIYDHERPDIKVALYHDVGKGKHLHVQVHPNTERVIE